MNGKLLLKFAAVASSLLLVGGFVSYQAGAFSGWGRRADPAVEATEAGPAPLMYGSKSAPLFDEVPTSDGFSLPTAAPTADVEKADPFVEPQATTEQVIMPGSKAMVLDFDASEEKSQPIPPQPAANNNKAPR